MKFHLPSVQIVRDLISRVPVSSWTLELEQTSLKYHITAAWVTIIFDPVFAITDFINIPARWQELLIIRIIVSVITYLGLVASKKFNWPAYAPALIPFVLLILQNAYTYHLIGDENLLGHNLNFMALFVGAALFALWRWKYSIAMVTLTAIATAFFVYTNPLLNVNDFFLRGGLLMMVSTIFMTVLIQARYRLTLKEIKTRLALEASNKAILAQDEQIKSINENLELLVRDRTLDLQKKNHALEETAFINAHNLRGPLASILGLIIILEKTTHSEEVKECLIRLKTSAEKLDETISSIKKTIERAD